MLKRTTVFRLLALAVGLTVGVAFGWPIPEAQAQQTRTYRIKPGSLNAGPGPRVGGYSTTLSDVWGPPDAARAERFRPAFRLPAGVRALNGPRITHPYPN